jgi:hypothetical protein
METGHALSLQPFLQPFLRPFYDHVHSLYPSFGGDRGGQIRNPKSKSPPFFSILKIKKKIKKRNPKPEFRYI